MYKSLLKLLGLTSLLAILFFGLNALNPGWVATKVYYLLGIFMSLTIVTTRINMWAAGEGNLVTIFIASQVLRIVLSLIIVYLFMRWSPGEANALVVNFFMVYLSFLIFEIMTVLSNLRAELRRPE